MQPRKYQGYAQGRGFNPINIPDESSRIAREGDQTLRGLERVQRQSEQNQQNYINSIQRVNNLEAQNRETIFNLDQRSRRQAFEDEMRNMERQKIDSRAPGPADQLVKDLEQLSGFSKTVTDIVVNVGQQKKEASVLYAKNLAAQYGVSPKLIQEYKENKEKLNQSATQINGVVNNLEFQGVPVSVLDEISNFSGWKLYGATVAYAMKGGEDYSLFRAQAADTPIPYNGETITLNSAKTEQEWEAANTYIRLQFLKLYEGINDALLDEHMYPKMRRSETNEKSSFLEQLYKNRQADLEEQKIEELRADISSDSGAGLLRSIYREAGYDPETGKNSEWLGAARRGTFKRLTEMAKKNLITPGQVEEMKGFQFKHRDGTIKTLGKAFEPDFYDLEQALFDQQKRKYEQSEFEEVQNGEQLEKLFLEKQAREGFTEEELQQAREKFSAATGGRESGVLKNIRSQERMRDEVAKQSLQYLRNRNLLTSKELFSGKYSEDVISEFRDAAKAGDSLASFDQSTIKKNLDFLYRRAQETRGDTNTDKRDSSAQAWVEMEIDALFKNKMLSEIQKGNRDGAIEAANDYVNNLIWDGFKNKKGPLAITGQISGMNPYAGMGKANSFVAQVTRAKGILERQVKDNSYLRNNVVLTEAELKQLNAFSRGAGSIPSIIFTLAQNNKALSPVDIANAQLAAAGMKPLMPVMSEQVRQGLTPMMRRILEYRPSNANTYQAFGMQGGTDPYRPLLDLIASQESTSYGGYEAMNRGGAAGGTVAIGSADSRNVFGTGLTNMTVAQVMDLQNKRQVFAAGRYQIIPGTLGGLMRGSYGFTGVNLNDPFNQATQDKLAVALIRGRAGRFFNNSGTVSEAVSGMGNEWIGLKKVKPQVIAERLQNAKVALNSQSIWRDPNNMRANVVYRIGNLGYGSTGPHLDLKRVDRGTTTTTGSVPITPNELDSFVDVQVKGKWKPLSRGTQITDGEQQHRNRSSYGVDFAAPEGTPVRLKNGARVVSSFKGDQGTDHLIIELPDGRRFQFLHGTTG